MVHLRMLPHREADPDSITWGQWWLRTDGDRRPADVIVDGWDYASQLVVEIQPSVDEDAFLESTGLPNLACCDVVAMLECPATAYRVIDRHSLESLVTSVDRVLSIAPPLGSISGRISLSCHVVLRDHLEDMPPDVARRPGARIASSPRTHLSLEGDGARFPTEAASFAAMGYDGALWSLTTDLSDPEEPFSSSTRLFINTDHTSADALIETKDSAHPFIASALEIDIVRQLVNEAARNRAVFEGGREWPEGSSGAALETLSHGFFNRPFSDVLSLHAQDQSNFERMLQARLSAFGGVK